VKIEDIIEDYGISVGAYYHWSNRYARDGILGLINKKAGAGVPYNKTPEDIGIKIVQIASDNKELDANDICDIVTEL
jgi:transposase